MDDSIEFAEKFLGDLLSFFGLNAQIDASHNEEVIELKVPSTHLNGFLIGNKGDTLYAIQSIVSSALYANKKEFTRVNIDIADYKRQNNKKLALKVKEWAVKVKESGEDFEAQPMNAADRRVVHQTISEFGKGLATESVGEGRDRHIVIKAG